MSQADVIPNDDILLKLRQQNKAWADFVNAHYPGFFAKTAEKQEPKVSLILLDMPELLPDCAISTYNRFSGSDVLTRAYQNQ